MPPPAKATNFSIYPSEEARILDQYIDQGMEWYAPEGSGLKNLSKQDYQRRKLALDNDVPAQTKAQLEYADLKLKLGTNPDPRIKFDDVNKSVHIEYGFKEFIDKFPEAAKKARTLAGRDGDLLQDVFLEQYATPKIKQAYAAKQEKAFDDLREAGYQEPPNPLTVPGNSKNGDQMMGNQDGLCVADDHGQPDGKQFLAGNMKKMAAAGVKTIFIEHFWQEHQEALDAYMNDPSMTDFPSGLKEAVYKLDYDTTKTVPVKKFPDGACMADVLKNARTEGVRIVGLDDFPAKVTDNDSFGERRAARFNQNAANVIKKNQKPGEKFLIMAGENHLNTHEGGIPGLGQILGLHTVEPKNGKLTQKKEDKSRRGMRSKLQQLFLDTMNAELRKQHPGKAENGVYKTVQEMTEHYGDQIEMMSPAGVMRLAQQESARIEAEIGKRGGVLTLGKVVELTDQLKEDAKNSPTALEKAAFIKAVREGDFKGFEKLADADSRLYLTTLPDGKNALHLAATAGDRVFGKLADLMNYNVVDKEGNTPMHAACAAGNTDAISRLAGQTDLTRANAKGQMPRDVIARNDTEAQKKLAFETNKAMKSAATTGNLPKLKGLVEKLGLDVNWQDDAGKTALHGVVEDSASKDVLNYLVFQNADVNIKDKQGNAPVHGAKNLQMLNALQRVGADTNAKNNQGETPLHLVMGKADPGPMLDRLLVLNADINEKTNEGTTLLHNAVLKAKPDFVEYLIGKGADVNAKDNNDNTPLHIGCKFAGEPVQGTDVAFPKCVKKLLDNGADPNAANKEGSTPLHNAAYCGANASIDHLFANTTKPVDLKLRNKHGMRAVDTAVGSGRAAVEQKFYVKDTTLNADIHNLQPTDEVSPIDLLMNATICESDTSKQRMRAMFTELYEDPLFRPVLKLAALDTFGTRDGIGKPALRIFATDTDMTASVREGGGGSYETSSNTLVLGSVDKEKTGAKGTLIHELTHHAVEMVYGNNAMPFKQNDGKAQKAYEKAVMKDVGTAHLFFGEDEKEISRVATLRCDTDYNAKKGKDSALQEFIVGIPQLVSHYGRDHVEKMAPGLTKFFEDDFAKACDVVITKHNAIANLPKVEPNGKPTPVREIARVNSTEVTADMISGIVAKELQIRNGVKKETVDKMAVNASYFEIKPEDKVAHDAKVQAVQEAVERALASNELPKSLSPDDFKALIAQVADTCDNEADLAKLDETVGGAAQKFARAAHKEYLDHRKTDGPPLDETEIAEAVVREAAYKALDASKNLAKLDSALGPDMNDSKHKKLVEMMALTLKTELNAINTDPWTFVDGKAGLLAADKKGGFFTEHYSNFALKHRGKDPQKVKVDIKNAKKTWIRSFAVGN